MCNARWVFGSMCGAKTNQKPFFEGDFACFRLGQTPVSVLYTERNNNDEVI